jgi:hypothetical protein
VGKWVERRPGRVHLQTDVHAPCCVGGTQAIEKTRPLSIPELVAGMYVRMDSLSEQVKQLPLFGASAGF